MQFKSFLRNNLWRNLRKGYLLCVKRYFRYANIYFHTHTNACVHTYTHIFEKWSHCMHIYGYIFKQIESFLAWQNAHSVGDPQKLRLFGHRLEGHRFISLFRHSGANISLSEVVHRRVPMYKIIPPSLLSLTTIEYSWIFIS